MQDQKSLTLSWLSFLRGDCDIVNTIVAHKGGQYFDYSVQSLLSSSSIWDATTRIVDTQFQEIVATSSLAFVAFGVANTSIMCHSDHVLFWLLDSQDQNLWTHCWRSFPGCGNELVTLVLTYTNGQWNHWARIWLCSPVFTENVRPMIVDAPLTLTLMIY